MNQKHSAQLRAFTHCFHCGNKLGAEEEYIAIRHSTLRPYTKDRWDMVGKACSNCYGKQTTFYNVEPLPLK